MDERGRIVFPRTRAEVEVIAGEFRRAFSLDPNSRVSMLPLLEYGIEELIEDFQFQVVEDGALGGAEAVTGTHERVIAMTNRTYRALERADGRARFTAAHEVGHLLLHCGMPTYYAFGAENDPLTCPERQANIFAAAFLMPEAAFRKMRSVAEAREAFGVSKDAALCRARHLRLRLDYPQRSIDLQMYRLKRSLVAPTNKKERRRMTRTP